jgi:hypothetical protein
MGGANTKVMGWGTIIAIMVGVGLVTGLLLGLTRELLGLSQGMTGGGVGASVGVVGAILMARRRAALNPGKNL